MKKRQDNSSGTLMIELSIVLPIFILVVLFLYGVFFLTSAQNQITHALFQASESLSLDPYLTEHVDSAAESKTFWSGLGSMVLDLKRVSNDDHFSSASDWYKQEAGSAALAKKRFVGYLTGGDEAAADEKLRRLGVTGGLEGMNFKMSVSGGEMTIQIEYELQFWFDAFGLGKIPMNQEVTAKLWGV